jgi:hypothetical protein
MPVSNSRAAAPADEPDGQRCGRGSGRKLSLRHRTRKYGPLDRIVGRCSPCFLCTHYKRQPFLSRPAPSRGSKRLGRGLDEALGHAVYKSGQENIIWVPWEESGSLMAKFREV